MCICLSNQIGLLDIVDIFRIVFAEKKDKIVALKSNTATKEASILVHRSLQPFLFIGL